MKKDAADTFIPAFYAGRSIFITGGTGFLGKVLIEKLLRSCPDVAEIFILMRPKKGLSIKDRLKKMLDNKLFDILRGERSSSFHKLIPITGDVAVKDLGLLPIDKQMLIERVSIIFHVAASVRFDESLKNAVFVNMRSTRDVCILAQNMKKLVVLLHVSSTYTQIDKSVIEEINYPSEIDWRRVIETVESIDEHILRTFTAKYLGTMPNTYVFAKRLAEQVINDYSESLPCIIIRPSIVVSTASDPVNGWLDNFNGPIGMLIGGGKGILRVLYANPFINSDYIPVDIVIKAMLITTWIRGTKTITEDSEIHVYNCSSSYVRKVDIQHMVQMGFQCMEDVPLDRIIWAPNTKIITSRTKYYILVLLLHVLPAIFIDGIIKLLGARSMLLKLQRKVYVSNNALSYFLLNEWKFCNEKLLGIFENLNIENQKDFGYDVNNFNVPNYFRNGLIGAKIYLLNEDMNQLEAAKLHYNRMIWLDRLVRILFFIIVLWILYHCLSVSSLEEDYGSAENMSTSPDTSCRSSADADKSFDLDEDFREKLNKFEDIIEKIENLRFVRTDDDNEDNKDANENVGRTRRVNGESMDNVEYRDTCKSQTSRHTDNEDINNNEDNVTVDDNKGCLPLNIRDEPREEERRHSLDNRNSLEDDSEGEQEQRQEHEDSDDSDLIQRGPIKPDFQPLRGHPYSMMVSWLSRANDSEDANADIHTVDYDKTAEQILRNKDYSEKLNPCLDQLSNSSRNQSIEAMIGGLAMEPGWTGENGNDIFHSDTATLPSIIVNDPGEESLMDILSRGGFQAAVFSDAGSHSIPSPGAKTWSDSPASSYSYVISRSNSRASSRAQSPGSGTNLESPQMHVNVIGSPLGSPQVASTYRVPQALSSSSSSNQSYSDVSSPLNYQTPLNYQIEEQLGESLSAWKGTYNSSGTIVNSSDTIDCALLQLVEQVIEEDKQRKALKEPQNIPCFSSTYNDQCAPVRTLENNLNPASRECSNDMRGEKPETCLSIPDANPIINSLPIDGSLMSVYTKESTSGCTFVSRTVNGHATNLEQRYYEPGIKGAQVNVSQHSNLHNIGLNDERSAKTSERNLNTSREKYAMFHTGGGEERYNQPSSTFVPNDYQIPTVVSSFVSSRPQRNSNRGIVPWPSLNLPSVRASERLKEGLHPKEVERAMSNLLKKSIEELAAADEDGDTALMCLLSNPEELTKKKAYLAPLVERLGNMPGTLSMVNNRGEDALYLAAMNCPEMPYVTGYLAAAMLQKGIDINQRLYHTRGDTLIHSIAARGDSHGEVLAELLALKTLQGSPVFDLSKCNYDGRTALHIAVESHDPTGRGVTSLATTRLLLENGADLKVKESKCGDTALHLAASLSCDPALVKVLLCKAATNVVNETNYMYNTPLHMAAVVSNAVNLERQKEVCRLLIQAGGQTNIQNRQGKTPLGLVSPERKEAIKRVFYRKL